LNITKTTAMKTVGAQGLQRVVGWCKTTAERPNDYHF